MNYKPNYNKKIQIYSYKKKFNKLNKIRLNN